MKAIIVTLALLIALLLSGCGHFGYQAKRQGVVYTIGDDGSRSEYVLEGAEPASFTVIRQHRYAKDRHAVYYQQTAIRDAIPSTFAVLDDWYAVDSESVFHKGAVLPNRDTSTFETISSYWTRDKNDAYFPNRAINACELASFKVLFGRWAADAECAYFADLIVERKAPRQKLNRSRLHLSSSRDREGSLW